MVIGDRETQTIEHFSGTQEAPAATRQLGRAARVGHDRSRHDLRLPRLQPRGGACRCRSFRASPTRSRRSSRPARCWSRSTTSRSGPTQSRASRGCSSRSRPTCASNAVAIFRIYTRYEPLRVFLVAAAIVAIPALIVWGRFLDLRDRGRQHRPRPVADARLDAVHRRRAACRDRASSATCWPPTAR